MLSSKIEIWYKKEMTDRNRDRLKRFLDTSIFKGIIVTNKLDPSNTTMFTTCIVPESLVELFLNELEALRIEGLCVVIY